MTRAFAVLMKFVKDCAHGTPPVVTEELSQAARSAIATAVALRSENAIVYIGSESGKGDKYFGSKEAVVAWVKMAPSGESRGYRTEELLF